VDVDQSVAGTRLDRDRSELSRPKGRVGRWIAERLHLDEIDARLVLPGGTALGGYGRAPAAVIRVKTVPMLLRLVADTETSFAEGYVAGAIEVDGDLEGLLERIYQADLRRFRPHRRLWTNPFDGSFQRARQSIHHHYDLGNDFYRLWLDREMVYTCAYFPTPDATLEEAQIAKMDLVCRKLNLRPGETVVEAGCGWGSLALYMARRYGVRVRAFNISHEQIAWARERAAREDVRGVEFIEDDYRNISGPVDAFVSVGMLEHVGRGHYPDLGAVLRRILTGDGRGLLHFIGRNQPRRLSRWIRRHVFPGAYPPVLREVFGEVLEPGNFSVLDVENLRLHYALTLRHWRERYLEQEAAVTRQYGEVFTRTWRLYLAGSEAGFATGSLQLFQVLFARGGTTRVPWTRDWLTGALATS
jgi:cyclopropane-fatty-acyl-phospholipid synthase